MPVAHAALELHANQWLGVDFGAAVLSAVPCVVSVMNTGSVLHITLSGPGCQWLCILGLLLQPLLPPACLAKGRLPKYRCSTVPLPPDGLKSATKKEIAEILLNGAVSRTDQHIAAGNYCTGLVQAASQTALCRPDLDTSWDCRPKMGSGKVL